MHHDFIFSLSLNFLSFSEVKVIAEPITDVTPINGYLIYPQSVASHVVSITTVDNTATENEKTFSVILVSSRGGADIDNPKNSRARLTGRLKNSPGYFGGCGSVNCKL